MQWERVLADPLLGKTARERWPAVSHADPNRVENNFQLFSPGGDAFRAFGVDGGGEGASGRGIAWIAQRPGAAAEFAVGTRFGVRTVGSFNELLAALDVVGEPCEFPLTDWPGVDVAIA